MAKSRLSEMWANETLSNNEKEHPCDQCEKCGFRSDGTAWSNDFRKSCCMMFPYPERKPMEVINNTGKCMFRTEV